MARSVVPSCGGRCWSWAVVSRVGLCPALSFEPSRRAALQLVGPFPTHFRRKISTESRPRSQPRGRWIGSEGAVVGSSRSAKSIPGCRLDKPTWRYLTSRWRFRSICRFPLGFHSHLEGCRMPRSKERRCAERHRLESCSPVRAICELAVAESGVVLATEFERATSSCLEHACSLLAALPMAALRVSPSVSSSSFSSLSFSSLSRAGMLPVIPLSVRLERLLQSGVTVRGSRIGASAVGRLAALALSLAGFFGEGLWRMRQRAASSTTGFSSECCGAFEAVPSSRQGNSLRTGRAASARSETGSISVRAATGARGKRSGARSAAGSALGETGWMRLSA